MAVPFDTIILLTGAIEAAALGAMLGVRAPNLAIRHVDDLAALETLGDDELARARLIAFSTGTIVPKVLLDKVGYGAYNFHPGPPTYPGWGPAYFALHDGTGLFGVTAHVMIERVDAGPIVDVAMFDIPPAATASQLERMTFLRLTRLFADLARRLTQPDPLSIMPVAWSGRKSTRCQLEALMATACPALAEAAPARARTRKLPVRPVAASKTRLAYPA